MTFLPIVVDPSHATGVASLVPPVCFASVAAGAHGLLVEVIGERTRPEDALSDGHQSIRPSVLADVIARLRTFAPSALSDTPA
jgi:3-deoxy-7-phosphoheptulonate synthase